jgi:hypothetical protein
VAKAQILARYGNPPRPAPPELVTLSFRFGESGHQTAFIERGYWIANCYTNLRLPGGATPTSSHARGPLSEPPPLALGALGHDRLELLYPPGGLGWIRLSLRVPDGFEVDAPVRRRGSGRFVRRSDLVGDRLRIRAVHPGPREGLAATLAAVVAAALWAGVYCRFGGGVAGSRSRSSAAQRA